MLTQTGLYEGMAEAAKSLGPEAVGTEAEHSGGRGANEPDRLARDRSQTPAFHALIGVYRKRGEDLSAPERALPYLVRLRLNEPATLRERIMRRVVLYALACDGALG